MWLDLGYFGLSLLMVIIIIIGGAKIIGTSFTDKTTIKKKRYGLIFTLLVWHIYIALIYITPVPPAA